MRLSLALDERSDRDKQFLVQGVSFVLDAFTAQVLQPPLTIVYDPEYDSFSVLQPGQSESGC
ncbi:MAG: hypothetical protein OWU32_04765 [Firmicutes bacterium]|nr:hypothetical protein [Bacillota bacterium]